MKLRMTILSCAILLFPVAANAQLTIDMNNITCGQYLAMPPSQSRSFSAWMSGWFSYQLSKERSCDPREERRERESVVPISSTRDRQVGT